MIMKKYIENMGVIRFGRFYNRKNKRIKNANENPLVESSLLGELSIEELRDFIDNDYNFKILNPEEKTKIYMTNPKNLLSKYRFDILIKYYYVKAYMEKNNLKEAIDIYLSHVKAFNNFLEPDGSKKEEKDFLNSFNKLIDDINETKKIEKTVIPISITGIPIDGSHRIAVALYFNLEVKYAVFDVLDGKYNRRFFEKRGMPKKYTKVIKKKVKL